MEESGIYIHALQHTVIVVVQQPWIGFKCWDRYYLLCRQAAEWHNKNNPLLIVNGAHCSAVSAHCICTHTKHMLFI